MKRKYVALMLGLTLALSSMAYAEETTEAVATEAAGEMELSEEEEALYGEITEIGEDSITIALGTLIVDEMQPAPDEEGVEAAEDTNAEVAEEAVDAEEVTDAAVDADVEATDAEVAEEGVADENGVPADQSMNAVPGGITFELTGEEETIQITEDTLFYREAAKQNPAEGPEEFAEGTAEEAEADAVAEESAAAEGDEEVTDAEVTPEDASVEGTDMEVNAEENGDELPVEIFEKPEQQLEEITFEDLLEGDVLKITLDEEGNAETVTVIMTEPDEMSGEEVLAEEMASEEDIMTLEEADTEE